MRSPREKMNKVKRVSYFIHCKNLCKCYSVTPPGKCYNVTPPTTTIRGKKRVSRIEPSREEVIENTGRNS
jgi:hypothetical protein